jgi:hypothetical protein
MYSVLVRSIRTRFEAPDAVAAIDGLDAMVAQRGRKTLLETAPGTAMRPSRMRRVRRADAPDCSCDHHQVQQVAGGSFIGVAVSET